MTYRLPAQRRGECTRHIWCSQVHRSAGAAGSQNVGVACRFRAQPQDPRMRRKTCWISVAGAGSASRQL